VAIALSRTEAIKALHNKCGEREYKMKTQRGERKIKMAVSREMWVLGHKLNKLRLAKGHTLQEVADAVGLSAAFLSMVENGRCGISFSNLQKLLAFYGVTIADLADKKDDSGRVVRLEEAVPLGYDFEGVEARLLVQDTAGRKIEPVYFRLQPGAHIGYMQHEGEEFGFVIEGTFEVSLIDEETGEEEKYLLEKGDTIYYSSRLKHRWTNLGNKVGVFIAAVTPSSF